MSVAIEGIEIGTFVCKDGRNQISIPIPHRINLDGLVEMELKISALWRPDEYTDSSDTRELGIAVYSIAID